MGTDIGAEECADVRLHHGVGSAARVLVAGWGNGRDRLIERAGASITRYNGCVPFRIRQFQKPDFDTLWQLDQACFDPQLAYSRLEMAFYMRRPGAFTLVAEAAENGAPKLSLNNCGADPLVRANAGIAQDCPQKQPVLERFPKSPSESLSGEVPGRDNSPAILGFILAELRRRTGHIITIDVVADVRRSGVGSALLVAAENRLRDSGAEAVSLETAVNNEAAIRFYKGRGYVVEKTLRGYYAHQLDALVMEKALVAVGEESTS